MPQGFLTRMKLRDLQAPKTGIKHAFKESSYSPAYIDISMLDDFDPEVLMVMSEGRKAVIMFGKTRELDLMIIRSIDDALEAEFESCEISSYRGGITNIWYQPDEKRLGIFFEFYDVEYTFTVIHGEDELEKEGKSNFEGAIVVYPDGSTKKEEMDDDDIIDLTKMCKAIWTKIPFYKP